MAIYDENRRLPHKYYPNTNLETCRVLDKLKSTYRRKLTVTRRAIFMYVDNVFIKAHFPEINNAKLDRTFEDKKFYSVEHYISFQNQNS